MGNGVSAKVDDGFKNLINRTYTPHFEKYVILRNMFQNKKYPLRYLILLLVLQLG